MVEEEDGLGAGKSKSQRAVFLAVQFETTRVHRWALEALWASRRVPSGGWRARSTKPPPRLMADNFQAAGLLSCHCKFGHVENDKCGKQGVHMNSKSTMGVDAALLPETERNRKT